MRTIYSISSANDISETSLLTKSIEVIEDLDWLYGRHFIIVRFWYSYQPLKRLSKLLQTTYFVKSFFFIFVHNKA